MNTIAPIQSPPLLGRTFSQQPGQSISSILQPEAGQLLKATVVTSSPDNHVLLQIGENQLVARSEIPLRPGQTLQLQIVSTSPQFELKIVNDTLQQLNGRPLTLVGNSIDITVLYTLIQQQSSLFEGLSLNSKQTLESFLQLQQTTIGTDGSGASLKQAIDRVGLSLESLLARGDGSKASSTLKAALLEILQNITVHNQASDNATKTLTTLEFFQLAQLHADSGQQLIFPLPLSFIEQGFLLIEQKEDEQGSNGTYENQEHRFSLHLKMSDIGNLRVDFLHNAEGLFIRFYADSQEKAEFIATFSEELKQAISETPILGLSFAAGAEDPAVELIRLIVPEGKPVLDTTA